MRITRLLLTFCVVLLCTAVVEARTVAMVFDDSGSMKQNGKWANANYSVQTLRGLLADDDRLLLVEMNEPGQRVWRSSTDAGRDIAELTARCRYRNANTPYNSVGRAITALAGSSDAERWLIVATDGNFEPPPPASEIAASIDDFLSRVPGGRVILLGIGEGTHNPVFTAWQRRTGAAIFGANDAQAIIPVLGEIAALVASNADTSRPLQGNLSSNHLSFTPEFPLKRLTILQQSTNQQRLVGITAVLSSAGPLSLTAPRTTATPGGSGTFGLISQARGAGGMIPAGIPIEIALAGPVANPEQLLLIPEVDARLEARFFNGRGEPLSLQNGRYRLCRNDGLRAELRLVFPQTAGAAPTSLSNAKAEVTTGGSTHRLDWEAKIGAFVGTITLQPGIWPVTTAVSFPGYFSFRQEGQLEVVDCEPRKISLALRTTDANRGGPGEWRSPDIKLKTAAPLELVALIDGREATSAEVQGWKLDAACDGLPLNITPPATGTTSWKILPKIDSWCAPCIAPTGKFLLTIPRLQTDRPDDRFTYPPLWVNVEQSSFISRCAPLFGKILGGLLLLWYLIGLFKKPRFARQGVVVYEYRAGVNSRKETFELPSPWYQRYLIPYWAETKIVGNLKFQAGKGKEHILLPHRQLSEHDRIWLGAERFDPQDRKDFRISNGETLKQKTGIAEEWYRFESTTNY